MLNRSQILFLATELELERQERNNLGQVKMLEKK
jgi:hypothetical protein